MIPNVTTVPLWDKIINLTLVTKDGSTGFVKCPLSGRKPTINVSGKMNPADVISDIDVRITNLFTGDTPLSQFNHLTIEAGYRNSLKTTIECNVNYAYQETPGPDGITIFKSFLGNWTDWANVTISNNWTAGTSVNSILTALAGALGLTLKSTLPDTNIAVSWGHTGLVKDFINHIKDALPSHPYIYPFGPFLIVYPQDGTTGDVHDLNYFVTPPRLDASGFNLTAPWDPTLKPGDQLVVNTKYLRQSYGGSQAIQGNSLFTAQVISFDFGTTDDTNSMVVLTTTSPK